MSLKLVFLIGLTVLTVIEARHFLKSLQEKNLATSFVSKSSEKAISSLSRKRRDAEENTTSGEVTDEDFLQYGKFFLETAWEGENKFEVLNTFLDMISDTDNNVTLVGWQRVYDEEGKVKEIRTVQLVIPPKPEGYSPSKTVDDDDDDDDDEEDERMLPYNEINEIKEVFRPMAALGIPGSVSVEEFNKEGEVEAVIFMDSDELYVKADGFAIYNKTSVATPQDVSTFIASLKPAALGKPAVLKYDVDGKFIPSESNIRPQLLGNVLAYDDVPDNILTEAPEIIAKIAYQYPKEEIPKQLVSQYNQAYPEYKWKVLVNADHYYVRKDVSITVSYDNADLDEFSDIFYVVYGVKKSTK